MALYNMNEYCCKEVSTDLSNLFHNDNTKKNTICSIIVDNNKNIQQKSENNNLKSPEIKQTIGFNFQIQDINKIYITKDFKIPPPPFLNQEIKNYSYSTLIKIQKSNT
jgi:hypothetical protein